MGEELQQQQNNSSTYGYGSSLDIESAASNALLREQEIETQKIIQGQREAGASVDGEENTDILRQRADPNALKEHLLKFTAHHRAETSSKRGSVSTCGEGNVDVGNGYGIPGGAAYAGHSEISEKPEPTDYLPEYLKHKLKARGILRDGSGAVTSNAQDASAGSWNRQISANTLPLGWVDAKDPATGATYYYNQHTGATQWERPLELPSTTSSAPLPMPPKEEWIETLDETSALLNKSLLPNRSSLSSSTSLYRFSSPPSSVRSRFTSASIRAVALEPELNETPSSDIKETETVETQVFACPVCYEPLMRKGPSGINLQAIYRSGFKCGQCNKTYSSKDEYLDLTVTAGFDSFNEVKPITTELFRSPLVSFLYERGWRQNFARSGFPGPDEEFRMAEEYFKEAEGGVLVDVSCGSGLFSRKFAKSGKYSGVIALDYSENMLRQCNEFIKKDATFDSSTNIAVVRADVSRLPFPSGSVDAVHAGAALHCWPSPTNATPTLVHRESKFLSSLRLLLYLQFVPFFTVSCLCSFPSYFVISKYSYLECCMQPPVILTVCSARGNDAF
ncbi:hypothetical protein F2Q69_00017804 [Brassica cretica]|uniref:WW domain-containing protein n=1 Tax=Brassica cretica TaxID=69181 RepID=A0A8S9R5H5_BRACR|nr:hypothetical protein F2Q69_00017804 [Brassica cretica]